MDNQNQYAAAKERVQTKIGFYIHLAVYLVVNTLLVVINLSASPEYIWFKWPMMGWGLAVLIHLLKAIAFPGGSVISEDMIQKEMEKGS